MILVFIRLWLAELKQNWSRILLPFFGIILGTTGYSAVRYSNDTILLALRSTATSQRSQTPFIIRSINGAVSENILQSLLNQFPDRHFYPRILRHLQAYSGEEPIGIVTLVGVDLLKEIPSGDNSNLKLLMDPPTGISQLPYKSLQLLVSGEKKSLEIKTLTNIDYSDSKLIIVDIATAQNILSMKGEVDEIGLEDNYSFSLPAGYQTVTAESFEGELLHATEALRLNLHFLAALCLVVSALIIYTSVSFTLLKRRREIGILLCTGIRRGLIVRGLIFESVLLGLSGALIGSLLGLLLSSRVALEFSKTISQLYAPVQARTSSFSVWICSEVLLLGAIVSVLGSLAPILSESRQSLSALLYPRTYEKLFSARVKSFAPLGIFFLFLCPVSCSLNLLSYSLLLGFIPPTILTISWLLLAPSFSSTILSVMKLLPFGGEFTLALSQLKSSPRRVSATVAACGIAIGLFLGVATMISSFRGTVSNWLDTILKADIFVGADYSVAGEPAFEISKTAIDWLRSKGELDLLQSRTVVYQGRRVQVNGVNYELLKKYNRLILLRGDSSSLNDDAILVSESFVSKFGQSDEVQLPGVGSFKIQGVFADYSNDSGVIYFSENAFQRAFLQYSVQGLSLYLSPDNKSHVQDIIDDFRKAFPASRLNLQNGRQLKDEVYRIFEQTFLITNSLKFLTLLLSLFVILNTVLMLTIERARDNTMLWAIGLRKSKILLLTALEGGILGGISALFGILQGVSFALLLVFFINKFFFGWSISFSISYGLFIGCFIIISLGAFLLSALLSLYRKFNSEILRVGG